MLLILRLILETFANASINVQENPNKTCWELGWAQHHALWLFSPVATVLRRTVSHAVMQIVQLCVLRHL